MKTILFFAVILILVTACNDSPETQPEISASIDWIPLPSLNQQSPLDVSIVNASGTKIESADEFVSGQEYTLVLKSEKPVAIRMDQNYGADWLNPLPEVLTIQQTHTYRITKTAKSGIENMIFQIVPMYYVDGVLTRELPQAFIIPKVDH